MLASVLVHALVVFPTGMGGGPRPVASTDRAPPPLDVALVQTAPAAALPPGEAVALPAAPVVRRPVRVPARRPPDSGAPHGEDNTSGAAVADPVYYSVRQLDVYPRLAAPLDLRGPGLAPPGRVLLLVTIDALGEVNEVSVVEAQPAGAFDDHALQAFRRAKFTAARRNGRPVGSRVLIEVTYGAEEIAAR